MRLLQVYLFIGLIFWNCNNDKVRDNGASDKSTTAIKESDKPSSNNSSSSLEEIQTGVGDTIGVKRIDYADKTLAFKVKRYVYTDLDERVLASKDVKQTTFIVDNREHVLKVQMADIYTEYYYYDRIDQINTNGKIREEYHIYKSYNTETPDKTLTDVVILGRDPKSKKIIYYQLYFGDKGFITFYFD